MKQNTLSIAHHALMATAASSFALFSTAFAQALDGRPTPKGINFQPPATALAEEVHWFHDVIILPVMVLISLFVLALLIYIVLRFNRKANPTPATFSHHTMLEVVWTGVPIIILAVISVFSFDLLFKEDVMPDGRTANFVADGESATFGFSNEFEKSRRVKKYDHLDVWLTDASGQKTKLQPKTDFTASNFGEDLVTVTLSQVPASGAKVKIVGGRTRVGVQPMFFGLIGEDRSEIATKPTMTLKVTGYQWGWNYAYPEFGDFDFDAVLMPRDQLENDELWLLEPTNRIIVPEGETVRMIITARDVIHAWTIPAFTVKVDAVPGRMNQIWFKAPSHPGVYYGQCSEICGKDHAFMPIAVEVVSREDFDTWVEEQQ